MRVTCTWLAVFLAAGCAAGYDIRTTVAPDARFSDLRMFRVEPGFAPLRDAVTEAFRNRGYAVDERAPDFLVSVNATVTERFAAGPPDNLPPVRWPQPLPRATTYFTDGVVTVDVRSPSRDLLWRGTGSTPLTDDPAADLKALTRVTESIVVEFPASLRRLSIQDPARHRR
jgi:hypothetical protein